MNETNLKYGFMSNYNETIFLRQGFVGGQWELQYSPIIKHSTAATIGFPANFAGCVSLRHLASCVVTQSDHPYQAIHLQEESGRQEAISLCSAYRLVYGCHESSPLLDRYVFAFTISGLGQLQPTRMPQGSRTAGFTMMELMNIPIQPLV